MLDSASRYRVARAVPVADYHSNRRIRKDLGASQAEASLRVAADVLGGGRLVELQIRDDGRGFDPADVSAVHLGLGIMRERADAIGAELQIESGIGRARR